MKGRTLICITFVLGVSMLQDARGGKTVSDKKLKNWGIKNENELKNDNVGFGNVSLKGKTALMKQEKELGDLLEVVQFVINNTINNQEFRTFLIKRFLHNYVKQATNYLNTIKEVKMLMDPNAAKEDDKKNKAMQF